MKKNTYAGVEFSVAQFIPAFSEFEKAVVNVVDAKAALKKANLLQKKIDDKDDCLYADLRIVIFYLQKLCSIQNCDPVAYQQEMFGEINQDIKTLYNDFDFLTSDHLLNVCKEAEISVISRAEELRQLIERAGLTQKAAALKLSLAIKEPVPVRTMQDWLGGQRHPSGFVMYVARRVLK